MALILSFLLPFFIHTSTALAADCDDSGKVYRFCADQKQLYEEAAKKAISENKMLLVSFGADWCPWCRSVHTLLIVEKEQHKIAGNSEIVEIAVYRDQEKLPAGWALLDEIATWSKEKVDKDGIPILAVVNPAKKKAVFIDTGKMEKNTKVTKGHDVKKLAASVKKALAAVK